MPAVHGVWIQRPGSCCSWTSSTRQRIEDKSSNCRPFLFETEGSIWFPSDMSRNCQVEVRNQWFRPDGCSSEILRYFRRSRRNLRVRRTHVISDKTFAGLTVQQYPAWECLKQSLKLFARPDIVGAVESDRRTAIDQLELHLLLARWYLRSRTTGYTSDQPRRPH